MIISHVHKFIYFKSYKTASTSTEIFFQRFCDRDKDIVGYRGADPKPPYANWWNHMSPEDIKNELNKTYVTDFADEIWDSYFKFGCIRNPWDRKLSSYLFCQTLDRIKTPDTFEEYCLCPRDHHYSFRTLYDFYNIPKTNTNFFIRFENLYADIRYVCDILNLPCDLSQLKHFKKIDHKHYSEYYNDEMIDKVAEHYKDDIKHFNYRFNE